MYTSFRVKHFRGFEELELKSLRRVNLITGENNVGKSALLEAVFLHSGAFNPELANVVSGMRGISGMTVDIEREFESPWDSLFHNYISSKPITFDADRDDDGWQVRLSFVTDPAEIAGLSISVQKTYERALVMSTRIAAKILKLEFRIHKKAPRRYFLILDATGKKVEPPPPAPPFPCRFYSATKGIIPKEEVTRFARVQIDGGSEFVAKSLAVLEPRLRGLAISMEAGEAMIHGDVGIKARSLIPLALMGDGINRLCSVLLLIATVPKGVVLVDEIEVGWHHSVLDKVWGEIYRALEIYDVQLFCTTHSLECVDAALRASTKSKNEPLRLYRLERDNDGNIASIEYDEEALKESRKKNFEVR
jgi:hypothetical protein